MRELALHILDIAENSISAAATQVRISISENTQEDRLTITIEDNGKGMSADTVARITDPFVTSRTTRKVGLGLPFFKAAAEACGGGLNIQSVEGEGTTVKVWFIRSHIDRMPLGDLAGTMRTLIVGSPEVHWILNYTVDEKSFTFDDAPIKAALDGVSLSEPEVLTYIRETLQAGINALKQDNVAILSSVSK